MHNREIVGHDEREAFVKARVVAAAILERVRLH
jgi:hypothetical protein